MTYYVSYFKKMLTYLINSHLVLDMALSSDDSDLHLTLFTGGFAPHGMCETAQNVVEELNGLPLGRLGPRTQYIVI